MEDPSRAEREKIFRGNLASCIAHFGREFNKRFPKGGRDGSSARKEIAEFCGVVEATVRSWFIDVDQPPAGQARVKAICFLDTVGYQVIELDRAKGPMKAFYELVGFGLLSFREAAQMTERSQGVIAKIFAGSFKNGTPEDVAEMMWEMRKQKTEELNRIKAECEKRFARFCFTENTLEVSPAPNPEKRAGAARPPMTAGGGIEAEMHIMDALCVLFDRKRPEEYGDPEIAALRTMGDSLVRLSGSLSVICGRLIAAKDPQKG